jgi:phage shock protein PspC (stress-responsive transcriptional regulator)
LKQGLRGFGTGLAYSLTSGGDAPRKGKKDKLTMTAQAKTNLLLRNDTILGVCEAIGNDFGFNPNWLRIAFCAPIYWNPALVVGVYLGLGVLVAVTRFAFPDRTVAVVEGDRPALVESATTVVEERDLVAA